MPSDREELALTLNGKKANLRRADFEHLATSLGLSATQSHRAIARMCKAFQSNLDEAIDTSFLSKGFQTRFRELAMARLSVFNVE
jgi:serine/threonine-protein kinase HipA